jgi:signal transduction histidine kinase
VSVTARSEDGTVLVSVIDTGPGGPREYASAIFDKFRQVPGTDRRRGTGLGLAIVKHIIQAHGGAVWVQSEGGGSTFTFQLSV